MKKSMSQISQLLIYIHQDGRQFITLYHTSMDYLEGVSSTGLPLQKKPMQFTCQLGSSASTSPLPSTNIIIRSDHLSLKKFLKQNVMNPKVNNWAVKHKSYNLKFEYIQGIQNTLVDTLSRLIEINPDVTLPTEPPGTEFGYNFFKGLPPVKVGEIIVGV